VHETTAKLIIMQIIHFNYAVNTNGCAQGPTVIPVMTHYTAAAPLYHSMHNCKTMAPVHIQNPVRVLKHLSV
jgi:hypothetical protein